jgi:hypothetical protein
MQICRDHGVQINNPHVYIVKDGKQHLAKLDAHLRENRARVH